MRIKDLVKTFCCLAGIAMTVTFICAVNKLAVLTIVFAVFTTVFIIIAEALDK